MTDSCIPAIGGSYSMHRVWLRALSLVVSIVLTWPSVWGLSTQFSFSPFHDGSPDIVCLGNATIVNGVVELTDQGRAALSTGRALYSKSVQLLDPASNQTASFSTVFTFAMLFPPNATIFREGLALVFVPDNDSLGDSGAQLGVYSSSNVVSSSHTLAVIFDTYTTAGVDDNHVGVTVTNISSLFSMDLGDASISFRNGSVITAWVDYDGSSSHLEIRLGYDAAERPTSAILSCILELSSVFNPYMFVGFSASDINSGARHIISSWNFTSSGIEAAPSSSPGIIRTSFVAGFSILVVVSVLACISVFWLRQKQKAISLFRRAELYEREVLYGPRKFSYKELSKATMGFSDKEKVGYGGMGSVYRGVLPDCGYLVAVKRIREVCNIGQRQVLAQVDFLGQLRHRNLVQLQGWCYDKGELLLVYEFMPNGSLDKVLFDRKGDVLTWIHRFKIVSGVAAGLEHLHEEMVVHRDIKASNVMLDNTFTSRLGDFGMAQVIRYYNNRQNTVVAGTFGYLAPEIIQTGKASDKTDVFGFGALTLEVACGRRVLEMSAPADKSVLIDWVWGMHLKGSVLEAADPRLKGTYDVQEMTILLHLGLLCTQSNPSSRPSMKQVGEMLSGQTPLPTVPTFKSEAGNVPVTGVTIADLIREGPPTSYSPDVVLNMSPSGRGPCGDKTVEIFENLLI